MMELFNIPECSQCGTQEYQKFGPHVCYNCIKFHRPQIQKYCRHCFEKLILCVGCEQQLKPAQNLDELIFNKVLLPEFMNFKFFIDKNQSCRLCGYYLYNFIKEPQENENQEQGSRQIIETGKLKKIHPWCLLREQSILTNGTYFMTPKEIEQKVILLVAYDKDYNVQESSQRNKDRYFYNLVTNNQTLQSIMKSERYEQAYQELEERKKRYSLVKHSLNGCQYSMTSCQWMEEILEQTCFKLFLHNSEIEANFKEYNQRLKAEKNKKLRSASIPQSLLLQKQQLLPLAKTGNKGVLARLEEIQAQIKKKKEKGKSEIEEAEQEYLRKKDFADRKMKFSGHAVCPGCLFPVGRSLMKMLPQELLTEKKEAYMKRTQEIMKNLIIE